MRDAATADQLAWLLGWVGIVIGAFLAIGAIVKYMILDPIQSMMWERHQLYKAELELELEIAKRQAEVTRQESREA